MARKRRIKAAKITHISLVPKGANRMPVIFKADDQTLDVQLLVKDASDTIMEKGELTAVVYAPETRDTQGDIASAEVIKDMMYDSARDGVSIDIRHDGAALAKNKAFVAESFIVQKGDPRFEGIKTYDGESVDPIGSWGVVLKIDDPELRRKYRDGEWNGVSMAGTAEVESEKADDMTEQVVNAMAKALGITSEDSDMTKDELTAALAKSNETLAEQIVKGITASVKELLPEVKKEDHTNTGDEKPKKKEQKAPVFKGDMTNTDDLLAHQRRLAVFNLRKDVDWGDGDSVADYAEKLAEFTDQFGELTDEDKGARTKPAASNQPASKSDDDSLTGGSYEGMELAKGDENCAKIGAEMAAWANQQAGFATK